MIELIEVDIGEKLTRLVADRQSAASDTTIDNDFFKQIKQSGVFYFSCEKPQQHLVICGVKVFLNIAFQIPGIGSNKIAGSFYGLVYTLVFSSRVRIGDKDFFVNRMQDTDYCVMHDAVSERSDRYRSFLRFKALELVVCAGHIRTVDKFTMQTDDFSFSMKEKFQTRLLPSLPFNARR